MLVVRVGWVVVAGSAVVVVVVPMGLMPRLRVARVVMVVTVAPAVMVVWVVPAVMLVRAGCCSSSAMTVLTGLAGLAVLVVAVAVLVMVVLVGLGISRHRPVGWVAMAAITGAPRVPVVRVGRRVPGVVVVLRGPRVAVVRGRSVVVVMVVWVVLGGTVTMSLLSGVTGVLAAMVGRGVTAARVV